MARGTEITRGSPPLCTRPWGGAREGWTWLLHRFISPGGLPLARRQAPSSCLEQSQICSCEYKAQEARRTCGKAGFVGIRVTDVVDIEKASPPSCFCTAHRSKEQRDSGQRPTNPCLSSPHLFVIASAG